MTYSSPPPHLVPNPASIMRDKSYLKEKTNEHMDPKFPCGQRPCPCTTVYSKRVHRALETMNNIKCFAFRVNKIFNPKRKS